VPIKGIPSPIEGDQCRSPITRGQSEKESRRQGPRQLSAGGSSKHLSTAGATHLSLHVTFPVSSSCSEGTALESFPSRYIRTGGAHPVRGARARRAAIQESRAPAQSRGLLLPPGSEGVDVDHATCSIQDATDHAPLDPVDTLSSVRQASKLASGAAVDCHCE
jgi:hypothetical protein